MNQLYRAACLTLLLTLSAVPGVALGAEKDSNPVIEVYVFDTGGDLPGCSLLHVNENQFVDQGRPVLIDNMHMLLHYHHGALGRLADLLDPAASLYL
jgi:hypothetical protein